MQTRREFLKVGLGGLGVISLGGSVPALVSNFAFGAAARAASDVSDDNVLVVIQLSGGNDGLNTVIPYTDDHYYRARPTLAIRNGLHKLDERFALHPGMRAFKELFDGGKLAIINGCGYPDPNRSHYRSMEIWHTATGEHQRDGWLGHYLDHARRGTGGSISAINVGAELPQALMAEHWVAPSVQSIEAMRDLARNSTHAMIDTDAIARVVGRYAPEAIYPEGLGQQLRLIAQLISGQLGTKVFYCQAGGFDTHANQAAQHERLLHCVATSIKAFFDDLQAKGLADKVMVMCFSEFGRRVEQNSSCGTDHGAAGPMFIVGGKAKGGIYGEHPSLSALDDGDLMHTTDFRRVYATVLDGWLNCDSAAVLKARFAPISFI